MPPQIEEQPVALAIYILIAEQLGNQLGIGRLAAARAGAGELEQRLAELAALDRGGFELRGDLRLDGQWNSRTVEFLLLPPRWVSSGFITSALLPFMPGQTVRAGAAARAVKRRR